MIILLVAQIAIGFFAIPINKAKASGRTYYVDNVAGSDSYDGLEQTHTTGTTGPFATIAHIDAMICGSGINQLNPGDSVLFATGETWREQLTVPCSGSSGSPITFGSFGSGANPIIDGANLMASWNPYILMSGWGQEYTATTEDSQAITPNAGLTLGDTSSDAERAIQWTAGSSYSLNQVTLDLAGNGSPSGNIWVSIYNDNGSNQPGSTDYGDSLPVSVNGISGSYATSTYTFSSSVSITNGTKYWAVINRSFPISSSNYVRVGVLSAQSGYYCDTYNGSSWGISPNTKGYLITYAATPVANIYQATLPISPTSIYFNSGTLGTQESSTSTLTGVSEWFWSSSTLYVYSTGSPTTNYTSPGIYSSVPANVWVTSLTTSPGPLLFNGIFGANESSVAALAGTNEWYWTSNLLFVYSTSNPSSAYTNPGIEAAVRQYGIRASNQSYLTIQNITSENTETTGAGFSIGVTSSSTVYSITLQNLSSSGNGWDGYMVLGDGTGTANNIHFINDTATNNGRAGFDVYKVNGDSTNGIVYSNSSSSYAGQLVAYEGFTAYESSYIKFYNSQASYTGIGYGSGASLFGSSEGIGFVFDDLTSNSLTYGCWSYNNANGGFVTSHAGSNNSAEYSISSNNGKFGFIVNAYSTNFPTTPAVNTTWLNDISYHDGWGASGSSSTSGGWTFEGNASSSITTAVIENSIIDGNQGYGVQGTFYSNSGITIDHNIIYGNNTATNSYVTPTNTITSNPLFTDGSGSYSTSTDFALQSTSSAIDSGINVGLTADFIGTSVPQGPGVDIGAYEYVQSGSPSVSVSYPASGSTVSGNINITALAVPVTPASLADTYFYIDSSLWGLSAATSSPSYGINSNRLINGSHTAYIVSTDNYGNTGTSSPVSFIVSNPMSFGGWIPNPVVTITPTSTPTNTNTSTVSTTTPITSTTTPIQAIIPTTGLQMPKGMSLTMSGQGSNNIPAVTGSFPPLTQTLSLGFHGLGVINLQNILKALGFFPNTTISNGNFGPLTLKAVQAFQLQYNIAKPGNTGYGVVGPRTRAALNGMR